MSVEQIQDGDLRANQDSLRSSLFLSERKTSSLSCLLSQTEFYSRVSCLVRLTCKTLSFVTKCLFAYDASESRLPLIKKDWVHSQSFLIYAKIETRTLLMFSFQDGKYYYNSKKNFYGFCTNKAIVFKSI